PDVVFDPVGGAYSEAALRSLAWNGRLLVVGLANGPIPKLPTNLALLMNREVMGVNWGLFAHQEPQAHARHMTQLAEWLDSGRIKRVVTEVVGFDDLPAAIARMGRRETMGKVVVRIAD